jgi:quercetin dioxygenase-like cupin family protein
MLSFNLYEEIRRLESEQPWQAEHTANTLVKYPDLRIVLVALKAGGTLHEHRTSGRISIQTLTGKVTLHLRNGIMEMPAGQLATLDHDLVHNVVAEVNSVFLLTIVWPEQKSRSVEARSAAEAFSNWFSTMQPADSVVPINRAWQQREQGLDETLAETFPCSDAISTLPNPLVVG